MCKKLCSAVVMTAMLFASICTAQQLDKTKYISIDEVKPGMDAYCLTVYQGTKIEKFPVEVISVAKNIEPGRNAILVKGLDPRFVHTGPVAGCSGSPVYIDGRLAGALAFGWPFSKDALYGVTPIEEMHRVGEVELPPSCNTSISYDFSKPIDLGIVTDMISKPKPQSTSQMLPTGAGYLPSVLSVSNIPAPAAQSLETMMSPLGFVPVTGMSAGDADPCLAKTTKFEPGSAIVVPMVDGDIKVSALGTVTDVVGDKVYGFGHSFMGQGAVELPVATGQVNTVVASLMKSFKFGNALDIKGALVADESTAIVGKMGKTARTIPLTVKIDRFNDANVRTYNCRLANHEMMSPMMLMTTVQAATNMRGPLPPQHSISYKVKIGIGGMKPLTVENVCTGDDAAGMLKDGVGSIALLMNNPYKKVCVESLELEAKIMPKSILSHIWSVDVSDTVVKAGQDVTVNTVIEPYLAQKQRFSQKIRIPENLKPGDYELMITGVDGYINFLKKAAPQKFLGDNFENLVSALRNLLEVRRDKLYCVLLMPSTGVSIESESLNDLPASKALILQDDKRSLNMRPAQNWIEESKQVGTVVSDSKTIKLTVEG